jgi:hypothetical protein
MTRKTAASLNSGAKGEIVNYRGGHEDFRGENNSILAQTSFHHTFAPLTRAHRDHRENPENLKNFSVSSVSSVVIALDLDQ